MNCLPGVRAIGNDQFTASIAADPNEVGMVVDWNRVTVEMPQPKAGKGHQTRINAVLRSYVSRMQHDQCQPPFDPIRFRHSRETGNQAHVHRIPCRPPGSPLSRELQGRSRSVGWLV